MADRESTSTDARNCFSFSFCITPKALLLVEDDQPEVPELNVFLKEAVGADDHVDLTGPKPSEDVAGLGIGSKPRQHVDLHGKRTEALAEGEENAARQAPWSARARPPAWSR